MRPWLFALLPCVALLRPHPVQAMLAVRSYLPPLRAAAAKAAQCQGILPGQHLVRVRIDHGGHGSNVELLTAPPGTTPLVRACITAAFAQQAYPTTVSARPAQGQISLSFPFLVAAATAP